MPSDPAAVMKERIAFAQRIKLGQQLLSFYGHVRYMPSWYASETTYYRGERWSSSSIPKEAIARVKLLDLATYGIEVPNYAVDWNAVVVNFSSSGKGYVFCAYDGPAPDWAGDDEDEPRWALSAMKAYVVELPSQPVLEDQVIYRSGDVDLYRFDQLESLRFGEWLTTLLKLADAVRAESEAHLAAFMKRSEAEKAKKFS